MVEISSVADAQALIGTEVGVSDWLEITQAQIDQFASATGDDQWIHVDSERAARELPNGKTIAHGYLTLALIPKLTAEFVQLHGLQRTINFGCNKVRFSTMISPGDRVRIRTSIVSARKRAGALYLVSEHRIEVEGQRKPACTADTIVMYFLDGDCD
ncbi:MAG: MaoC family dehydratase [Pseudomonadota bacterium]